MTPPMKYPGDHPVNDVKANGNSPRRALLDLAPLELHCMNTLWPMGEGTVREIRDRLAERLPRAYTTIMTVMDRLAGKGIVERRKVRRAYVYRPNLSPEQASAQALGQVLRDFFGGSKEALLAQLAEELPASGALRAGGSISPAGSAPPEATVAPPGAGESGLEPRRAGKSRC
jgi:BlaI family transcriptional regulator, penicillinase repressor